MTGQTFYLFTLENLRQFGALKAMGVDNLRLVGMILLQALVVGGLGPLVDERKRQPHLGGDLLRAGAFQHIPHDLVRLHGAAQRARWKSPRHAPTGAPPHAPRALVARVWG